MWMTLTTTLLLVLSPGCFAGNHQYWWMNNPSVFSSGGQQQQQQQPINSNLGSQNNYNPPSQTIDQQDDSYVETECPVGTKCVQDHFCNEQAVMVSYRVDLTPAQKRNRGKLIPCVSSGNGGFDVCCSTSPGSSLSSSSSNTFVSSSNNNQGFSGELRQPVQQQQQQQQQTSFSTSNTIPTGECPNIAVLPPVESCSQRTSNCWSVGQADVDCENNALCCFDGCVNACYFGGSSGSSSSSTSFSSGPARIPSQPQTFPSSSSSTSFQSSGGSFPSGSVNVPSTDFQSSGTFQDSSSTFEEQPAPTNIHSSSTSFQSSVPATTFVDSSSSFQESAPAYVEEESNPPAFPTPAPSRPSYSQGSYSQQVDTQVPETSYIPPPPQQQQTFTPPRKQQQQQQKPFSPPRQQTNFQSSSSSSTFQSADTKPFVTCPSAMKCVPRVNCDFNGVMVEQTLNLTPELEMLRVPLIPCINPQTTNIEVCCRDPNYTDPWPMDNGNGGNGKAGNFVGNGNGGNFKGNDNSGYSGNNQGAASGIVPRVQAQPELVQPVAHQQQAAPRRSSYGK